MCNEEWPRFYRLATPVDADLIGFIMARVHRNSGTDKDASQERFRENLSGLFTIHLAKHPAEGPR